MGVVEGKYLPFVAYGMTHLRQHFLEVGGSPLHDHVDTGRIRSPSAAATKDGKGTMERVKTRDANDNKKNRKRQSEGKLQQKKVNYAYDTYRRWVGCISLCRSR